ncbi:MAG: hypothetical protein KF749_01065 [Bacteroidetes bacterium]|nr:hypothetical protein [Bacteroidota bacterium]MCW5897258.1 hypothetical protein [Bacteroidota bacterium]
MKQVARFLLFILLSGLSDTASATPPDSIRCYVWDFTTRSGQRNLITQRFTIEFEEKLAQQGFCRVLERRNFARLIAHRDNETAIHRLDGVSQATLDTLKAYDANTVVFGEVYDDTSSGEYRIAVTFQNFDNTIKVWSIRMPRGLVNDAGSREKKMEELVENIAKKPRPPDAESERRKSFLRISRVLREFSVRTQKLNTLCGYLPELAHGNKRVEEELAATVVAYNQMHDSLTINQNAIIEEIEAVWQNQELTLLTEKLLRFALEDIHRNDVFVFNEMFVMVMDINNKRITDRRDVERIRTEIKQTTARRVESLNSKLQLLDDETDALLAKLKQ